MDKIQKLASTCVMDPRHITTIVRELLNRNLHYSCSITKFKRLFSVDCLNMTFNGVFSLTQTRHDLQKSFRSFDVTSPATARLELVESRPIISSQVYIEGVDFQQYSYCISLLSWEESGNVSLKIEDIPVSVKFRIDEEQSESGTISLLKLIEWKIEEIEIVNIKISGLYVLEDMKNDLISWVSDEVQNTVRNSVDELMNKLLLQV